MQVAEILPWSQEADLEQFFRILKWLERERVFLPRFRERTVEQRRSKPVEYCLRHIDVALANVAWHRTGNSRTVVLDTSLRVN